MNFDDIEVDEDVWNLLSQVEHRAPPAPAPAAPIAVDPVPMVTKTDDIPPITASPPKQLKSARWMPSTASTPSTAPVPAPTSVSPIERPAPTSSQSLGAHALKIELTYGGRSRIRVTVSASAPVSVFSSKTPFQKAQKSMPPAVTQENLPTFVKDVFAALASGADVKTWDLASESGTWPLYEESTIDLAAKMSSVLAHWLFPARLLPQIDLLLRRAVDAENSLQARSNYASSVKTRYVGLPEYVRKLILECTRIYRDAERISAQQISLPRTDSSISSILPPALLEMDLFKALKDYQVKGVEYAFCRNGRLLLADAPGLGKTLQAIAIACCYEQDWPVLVICPSSVRAMWANEFQSWIPDLSMSDVSTNFVGRKTSLKAKVNIISYELLKTAKIIESVWSVNPNTGQRQHPFGVVICDECHLLKTFKSARTQAIMPLVQRAKRAILLSGTPATSRPSELHTQLSCVLPSVFQYFSQFGDRYCDPKPTAFGGGTDYSGASNLHELHLLLTESLMIRRQKSEVLGDMPTKRRHQLLLEVPKEQRKMLIAMAKELAKLGESLSSGGARVRQSKKKSKKKSSAQDDSDGEAVEDNSIPDLASLRGRQRQVVLEMFQNAGRAKLPSAIAHLQQCMENYPVDTKFLVFAHHVDVLDGFSHALRESGVEFIRIDGKTANTSRQPLVDHFQQTPSCRVALLSILAAGVGITLTRASKVFFAELYWDPATLLQAEDRAHRLGQDKDVDVFYMIAKGSYDERLWEAVDSKLSILSAVLDAKKTQMQLDSVSKSITTPSTSAATDSFINYLIQKIDGYQERSEEAIERAETRKRGRNGTLLDSLYDDIDDSDPLPSKGVQQSISSSTTATISHYSSIESRRPTETSSASRTPQKSVNTQHQVTVIDDEKDYDSEDSFEAVLREPPLKKKSLPETAEIASPFSSFSSPSSKSVQSRPPPLPPLLPPLPADTERKRMNKLSLFSADE